MSSYIHPVGAIKSITVGAIRSHDSGDGTQFYVRSIMIALGDGSTMEISAHGVTVDALCILYERGRELTAAAPPDPASRPHVEVTAWVCPDCGHLSDRGTLTCARCGYAPSAAERCDHSGNRVAGTCWRCGAPKVPADTTMV